MKTAPFILASASPRRLNLLSAAGLTPEKIIPADLDEAPVKSELPAQYVLRIAEEKARAVAAAHPGITILAADTTVACGRRILGKPANEQEASRFLSLLSGRRHRVYTGVAIITGEGALRSRTVMTTVQFKRLHAHEISAYIASNEWHGKAGGYAIQGLASRFVTRINGSYTNVVGLPIVETVSLLT